MKTPILQFGTSRFLQAHADLFVSQARDGGQDAGPITVVQTTGSAERAARLSGLTVEGGFPIHVKGLKDGKVVDEIVRVSSVVRTLSALADWPRLVEIFCTDVKTVITNTADAGYDISAESDVVPSGVPVSFPGKLTALLMARFAAGGAALDILPCELISKNGEVLKALVQGLARRWYPESGFLAWLETDVRFVSTLVDRIVSEPIEPAGAVAEPYALWAIESQPGFVPPCTHPSIVVADDITPFEKLKLFILNLGHTVLADDWNRLNLPDDLTVRAFLADPTVKARLLSVYAEEVVPGFRRMGMETEAQAYVISVMERFENPFLNHRLKEIHGNHRQKIERRLKGFLDWSGQDVAPALRSIIAARAD